MSKTKYDLGDYKLNIEQVAEMLGYSEPYLRTLAREKKIPALKRFRQWLFCKEELETFYGLVDYGALDDRENDTAPEDSEISDLFK